MNREARLDIMERVMCRVAYQNWYRREGHRIRAVHTNEVFRLVLHCAHPKNAFCDLREHYAPFIKVMPFYAPAYPHWN